MQTAVTSKFTADRYKLSLQALCIEVTRRCNMTCAHCMRGDAENKDLNPDALDRLFSKIRSVSCIVPTGGEPSLNPDALLQIKNAIQAHHVNVEGIYMVTNGKEIPNDFIMNFMHLLLATNMEEECCGLALSQDMFHDKISYANMQKLRLLSCYHEDDKKTDWNHVTPIALGRAEVLQTIDTRPQWIENPFYDAEIDDDSIYLPDGTLTLTVNGDILTQSDYAYDDTDKFKICNVFDNNWFNRLAERVRSEIE